MADVEPHRVASKRSPPSTLAYAWNVPYLAAGTAPGSTGDSFLRFYGPALDVRLSDLGAVLQSPAKFCRLSWSKPLGEGCSSSSLNLGLIAGGLENGDVAVWDPRDKLQDIEKSNIGWKYEPQVIEDHFCCPQDVAVWDPRANVQDSEESNTGWKYEPQVIEDHFCCPQDGSPRKHNHLEFIHGGMAPPPRPQTSTPTSSVAVRMPPPYLRDLGRGSDDERYSRPPRANTQQVQPADNDTCMVALFSRHQEGPVRGLGFSTCCPNLLASGTMKGSILIWDVAISTNGSAPTVECYGLSKSHITYLAWSPSETNLIASTSYDGAYLWDTRASSPLAGYFESIKGFATVQWSPTKPNIMIAGAEDSAHSSSLVMFDKRKLSKPLKEFCNSTTGISSLSWCPNNDKLIGSTTNEKIMIWEGENQTVLSEIKVDTRVSDVHWSKVESGCFVTASDKKITFYKLKPMPMPDGVNP